MGIRVLVLCAAPVLALAASVYQKRKPRTNRMHLMARPESARANSEATDVYLAPDDYLKDFGCHFAKGDKVFVKGSKGKFNSGPGNPGARRTLAISYGLSARR
jgi:hypothetical protein